MLGRVGTFVRLTIAIVGSIVLLIPVLLCLMLILWIFDLPRKAGQWFNFDRVVRFVVYRVFDPNKMRRVRDDFLHIVEADSKYDDNRDRWGLIREIDQSRYEIEQRLRNGEFFILVLGAFASFLIGNLCGLLVTGAILTLLGLLFSILVTVRIVFTEILYFKGVNNRHQPIDRLIVMKGWNTGPVFSKGIIGVAILSLLPEELWDTDMVQASLDILSEVMYDNECKWQTD
jgi:hypothetical protein